MAKALYTPTQIVAKGNELACEIGREPSAWEVHKALGGKGNPGRVKDIWENRKAGATKTAPTHDIALPDAIQTRTGVVIEQMHQSMASIISDAVSNAQAAHNRQMVLAERDWQNQTSHLQREIDYLNKVLEEREQEINDISAELSRKQSAKPAARKQPLTAKPSAQKSQRPPSRTTPLENPKHRDPLPEPQPAPEQAPSR